MKKTMYKLGFVALLGLGTLVNAQVGINEESPKATLDIKAKTTTGDALEGIIIPQVSEVKAEAMGANSNIKESTLIYVDDVTDATTQTYTAKVDTKGFYYFDGTEWQKVGKKEEKLQTIQGNIREVTAITPEEWAKPNTFALVQTSGAQIKLPDPSKYTDKIIAVNNQYNNQVTYFNTNKPKNASTLFSGKGHLLMSSGSAWYIIGGSY